MKEILGNEYYDYNIVMSLPNGRPMEGQVISRSFKRLIRKNHKIVSKKNGKNELLAKRPVFVSKAVKTRTPC